MRVILTLVAVAVVTLLTAALVAPYLIDWSAHRAEVAARLEALTGGRVALDGPVTLRLLPTPYLEVGAGSAAGAEPDAPRLTFAGARLELALVKLASGAFRFTDVRLEKPVLTLTRQADGELVLPAAAAVAGRIGRVRRVLGAGRDDPHRIAGGGAGMDDRRRRARRRRAVARRAVPRLGQRSGTGRRASRLPPRLGAGERDGRCGPGRGRGRPGSGPRSSSTER